MRTTTRRYLAGRLRDLLDLAEEIEQEFAAKIEDGDDGEPIGCAFEDLGVARGHLEAAVEQAEASLPAARDAKEGEK